MTTNRIVPFFSYLVKSPDLKSDVRIFKPASSLKKRLPDYYSSEEILIWESFVIRKLLCIFTQWEKNNNI